MPEKKRLKRSLFTKGLLVILSLVILIFISSYAWFVNADPNAGASGVSVKAGGSAEFEYAVGFYNSDTGQVYKVSDWMTSDINTLNLESIPVTESGKTDNYSILKDYQPIDITGDGSTLIKPAMMYMNKAVDQSSSNFSFANPNVQYITFDLIFRSKTPGVTISLDEGCWVKGSWETKGSTNSLKTNNASVIANEDFNVSTYAKTNSSTSSPVYDKGAFSKDAIAGAVRMSFVNFTELDYSDPSQRLYILKNTDKTSDTSLYNDNCEKKPAVLWNPRGELCLNPDIDDTTSNWTLDDNKTISNTDGFSYSNDNGSTTIYTSTYDHTYYQIFESKNNSVLNTFKTIHPGDNEYNLVNNPAGKSIAKLADGSSSQPAISGKYYGKTKVNIWVEGCDKEARRALSGGKYNFHLVLKGSNQ